MADVNALPPLETLYHFKAVPVAARLETVAELQKDCADAVGAGVTEFMVTDTAVLELSQPFSVCET